MKGLFTIVLCFLISVVCLAQTPVNDSIWIRKIADHMLTHGKAYDDLKYLTKNIGGRLAGSPQMVLAENWGKKTLEAAGADRVLMQECMVPNWKRGGDDKAQAFLKGKNKATKSLDVVALGNSLGSGAKGIKAPVVLIQSFDDLEAKKDDVKGKIVFYNYKFNPTLVRTFEAYGDASKYRGQGASRAAKYGAVGVVVRSMSHSTDNNPHTGGMRYDSAYPKIPAAAIGLQDADWLADQLSKSEMDLSLTTHGYFRPDTIGHNVIGEIKGSEFPDEIITIGGHLDSWDNCEGAHDDGAGCVQTIEILRTFKAIGYKPKRTIRFVLFANEENGLRGGSKYAEEAKAKNEKHIFALESDAGGFTPRGFGITASDTQFEKISTWTSLIAPFGASEIRRGGGGADIGPLNRTFGTPVAGLSPDSQRYFDIHHARNDVFEAVNKRELILGAVNMAVLIYLVDQYGL